VALVGDASGSVDAVTGSGMSLGFQQALAVAAALRVGDLGMYERAHGEIRRSAGLLSALLLQLDRFPALRGLAFRSFRRNPELFAAMLALHSGARPFCYWGANGALTLGLQTLLG
jgi:flavin-dependent dehydrogenase